MENWRSLNQSASPNNPYHHDNDPAHTEDETDWMDHQQSGQGPKEKEAWFKSDVTKGEERVPLWMDQQESGQDPKNKEAWFGGHGREGEELETERAEIGDKDLSEEVELGAERAELGEDDVYAQLAQKEQDLVLAAELGKALLDKNQELEDQISRLTQDFGLKLEALEQERHSLQYQLTQRQTEYENTIRDLQDDVNNLQEQLRHHDSQTSAEERKHVKDLRQLEQHNEQLNEQLRQSLAQQQSLSEEAGQLREQLTARRSNYLLRTDHVTKLQEEVDYLQQRHQELESQVREIREERDALAAELESLQERLLLLEKQRRYQDEQLHHQSREAEELRETNCLLQSQLDQVTSQHHPPVSCDDSPTLYSELSHFQFGTTTPSHSSFIQFHNGETVGCLSADMLDEDDFEYDDDIFCDVITHSSPVSTPQFGCHGNPLERSLQEELMCHQEEGERGGGDGEREGEGGERDGREEQLMLSSSLHPAPSHQTLQCFLQDQYSQRKEEETENRSTVTDKDKDVIPHEETERDVTHMTYECSDGTQQREIKPAHNDNMELLPFSHHSQHHLKQMLQNQQCRIERLEARVQELERRVQQLQQERDSLQDAASHRVCLSQVVCNTRCERDAALNRISELEQELSRLSGEVVTLNGQLMDRLHRKVVIAQQIDQWKVDLSEVMAVQNERRMRDQENMSVGPAHKRVKSDPSPFPSQFR